MAGCPALWSVFRTVVVDDVSGKEARAAAGFNAKLLVTAMARVGLEVGRPATSPKSS